MNIKFKRLPHGEGLPLPNYATPGAAGMDICAAEDVTIYPGIVSMIKTGWAVEIPEDYEIQCRPRSGLAAKHNLTIPNSPGTIDSDYRGEICILMTIGGNLDFPINKGDRVAQLVISPVTRAQVEEVEELGDTQRGTDGFGSTGRN